MKYTSENMNYIFNVSYFDDIDWAAFGSSKEENDSILKQHNDAIRDFSFKIASPVEKWRTLQMKGYTDFQLCTQYPGLMIGTGNEHSLKMDGAIKCGFSFDYTTGLPYIPGSSLKGALRACFPGDGKKEEISQEYAAYIRALLDKEDVDIEQLKENIFENQDIFEKHFPADFISEAVDQTRGWFYSLMAISTLLFDKAPFKNVIVLGHVQDKDGQKMSKSKGNAVDPMDALNKYGADAIRWYFYSNSAPWLPNRFHEDAVIECQRKFLGTLWNTYAFYVLYANIDNFNPLEHELDYEKLSLMDKWLLSKLNSTVKAVDENLAAYKIPETTRVLEEFVDDLSNWYVRRGRERYWAKGMEQDKVNAYMTLYTALVTISMTAAPLIPFMAEDIYQNLVRSIDKDAPLSVHLCEFPKVEEKMIDTDLEVAMDEILKIVVLGRAARNTANIKNRQPIGTMYVKAAKELTEDETAIVKDELNIKNVVFTEDIASFSSYTFKPQLRTVGPKYGKQLGGIKAYLSSVDGNAAMAELKEKGALTFDVNGTEVSLAEEDLLIDIAQTEGYVTEADGAVTVVIDTNLTEELLEEGFVREIVSKIQTMRKEAGFEVMDKITVYAEGSDKATGLMNANADSIKSDVMADALVTGSVDGYSKEWNINGENAVLATRKA
mgnify:CR=1 FL=1